MGHLEDGASRGKFVSDGSSVGKKRVTLLRAKSSLKWTPAFSLNWKEPIANCLLNSAVDKSRILIEEFLISR